MYVYTPITRICNGGKEARGLMDRKISDAFKVMFSHKTALFCLLNSNDDNNNNNKGAETLRDQK